MQDKAIVDRDEYEPSDWEDYVEKYPVRVAIPPGGPIPPRTLVVGITLKGKSKAWPHASVVSSGATLDQIADVPVLLVVSPDGRSVRAFDRRARGQTLSFIRAGRDITSSTLLDLETMSEWDFTGPRNGRRACGRSARANRASCSTTGSTGRPTIPIRTC